MKNHKKILFFCQWFCDPTKICSFLVQVSSSLRKNKNWPRVWQVVFFFPNFSRSIHFNKKSCLSIPQVAFLESVSVISFFFLNSRSVWIRHWNKIINRCVSIFFQNFPLCFFFWFDQWQSQRKIARQIQLYLNNCTPKTGSNFTQKLPMITPVPPAIGGEIHFSLKNKIKQIITKKGSRRLTTAQRFTFFFQI